MTISVICEECGKRYNIPLHALEQIQGDTARTRCRQCGHVITITKPTEPETLLADDDLLEALPDPSLAETPPPEPPNTPPQDKPLAKRSGRAGTAGGRTPGLGLRNKMIILFCVVPLALMSISGALTQRQMNTLATVIAGDSASAMRAMAEENVHALTRVVMHQLEIYLDAHPALKAAEFQKDPVFISLAQQPIGRSGYTALYQTPAADGKWRMRVHPDQQMVSADFEAVARKDLGTDFAKFWQLFIGVREGASTAGYCKWRDPDGQLRDQYMVCMPLAGTPYAVMGKASVEEFAEAALKLERRAVELAAATRNISLGILMGTLTIIFATVSIYGHRLTSRIKNLTDIADRISVGELDAEIRIRAKDEIGSLAEAISRMQDSLRLSIERLRRRR